MGQYLQSKQLKERYRMSAQFGEKKVSSEMFHKIAQVFKTMQTPELKELLAGKIADKMENGLPLENLIEEAWKSQEEIIITKYHKSKG